jgi:cytochrome P450
MEPKEEKIALSAYSLLDNRVQSDPYEFYSLLHEKCPIYQMPETGIYVVTKYEDVRAVLLDTETFSSVVLGMSALQGPNAELYQQILRERGWEHVHVLHRNDPPEHTHYRKLVDRVFTIRRVRELLPHIEEVANELIETFIARGTCEFIGEFAVPMPGIIMAEQLGLERGQVDRFKTWAEAMLATSNRVMSEQEIRATAEIELDAQHYLADLFEKRRLSPSGDLISGLVHAHGQDENPLTMHELQNVMHQLITGGFETTPSALAHGLWLLIRHPVQLEALRRERGLIRNFVEEVLRIESPVQGLMRTVKKDTEIGDTKIPAGSVLIVRYGAANRDANKFSCPAKFDIARHNPAPHMSFGWGAHLCVGASLARQEIATAFNLILDRLEDIELARPLPDPPHLSSLNFLTLKELPIRFSECRASPPGSS